MAFDGVLLDYFQIIGVSLSLWPRLSSIGLLCRFVGLLVRSFGDRLGDQAESPSKITVIAEMID